MGGFCLVLDAPYVVYVTRNQVDITYGLSNRNYHGEGPTSMGLPRIVLTHISIFSLVFYDSEKNYETENYLIIGYM